MTIPEAEEAFKRIFPGTVVEAIEVPTTERPSKTPGFDQFLADLFTTAMEGGIGYWSSASSYHIWIDGDSTKGEDLLGFYADITDDEQGGDYRVNRRIIARGWRKLSTHRDPDPASPEHRTWRDSLNWSSEKPPVVWSVEAEWDFDASDADMILQLGLLDDVVYG